MGGWYIATLQPKEGGSPNDLTIQIPTQIHNNPVHHNSSRLYGGMHHSSDHADCKRQHKHPKNK